MALSSLKSSTFDKIIDRQLADYIREPILFFRNLRLSDARKLEIYHRNEDDKFERLFDTRFGGLAANYKTGLRQRISLL